MRPSTVSVTGVAASPWLPVDYHTDASQDGIFVKVGAGGTYTVEVTPDDIFDPTVTPVAFPTGIAALTAATTNQAAVMPFACRAVRVNQSAGANTTSLTFVPRGGL